MTKKLKLVALSISTFAAFNIQADYLLTLTDNSAQQTTECVKSYSFSNNLESLARNKSQGGEVYSYEETVTQNTYLGKPVYRRLIPVDGVYDRVLGNYPDIDILVKQVINMASSSHSFSGYTSPNYFANIELKANRDLKIASNFSSSWGYAGDVVIEYTKTSDIPDSASRSFKSYIHYVPSASVNEEVTTVTINDMGIQLKDGYAYDANTASCNPI